MPDDVQQHGTAKRFHILLGGFAFGQKLGAGEELLERASLQLGAIQVFETIGALAGAERDHRAGTGGRGPAVCRRDEIAAGRQIADRESLDQKMPARVFEGR